jgi:hypothetical protein
MINYIITRVEGVNMEGFEISIDGETFIVTEGTFFFEHDVREDELLSFPSFSFDVLGDPELPVQYIVYLCEDSTVYVQRNELLEDTMASYMGASQLLQPLVELTIEPGQLLADAIIDVRLSKYLVKESENE